MKNVPTPSHASHVPRQILIQFMIGISIVGCAQQHAISTIEHPQAAVVAVSAIGSSGIPALKASGFFVSADGLVVTCRHVMEGSRKILVTPPGGTPLEAEFVEEDRAGDVAILRVHVVMTEHAPKIPFLKLHEADIEPGTHVRVAGLAKVTDCVFDRWENFGSEIALAARTIDVDAARRFWTMRERWWAFYANRPRMAPEKAGQRPSGMFCG